MTPPSSADDSDLDPALLPDDQCLCGGDSHVLETASDRSPIRRRRECRECGRRWTTYERRAESA